MGSGSAAPGERYYRATARYYRGCLRYYRRDVRYDRRGLLYYRSAEQYYRMPQNNNIYESFSLHRDEENGGCSKVKGKGGAEEENVYVMIPPEPFQRGPPLNSTAFL